MGVVGHSVFFKVYTASEAYWDEVYCEETNDKYPCEEYSLTMMNCEMHADRTILPYLKPAKKVQDETEDSHEAI